MTSITRWYTNFMREYQDVYTKGWFMVGDPSKLTLLLITYVIFSTKVGPKLMKDRKPFKLNKIIQIYNLFQVFVNAYLVYLAIQGGWFTTYSFKCQPVEYTPTPTALTMRRAVWLYYMVKLSDLLDTVFFVLRKKYNQVTYLHIYHHTLMPICSYIGTTFLPGGHGTLLGLINAFVHIVLYLYYFLAALGPEVQKHLWWKKYVTKMQLIQFGIILIHNLQVLPRQCGYPKVINFLLCIEAVYFIYLFGSFYVRAYIENKPQITIVKVEENGNVDNEKTANASISNGHPFSNGKSKTN